MLVTSYVTSLVSSQCALHILRAPTLWHKGSGRRERGAVSVWETGGAGGTEKPCTSRVRRLRSPHHEDGRLACRRFSCCHPLARSACGVNPFGHPKKVVAPPYRCECNLRAGFGGKSSARGQRRGWVCVCVCVCVTACANVYVGCCDLVSHGMHPGHRV